MADVTQLRFAQLLKRTLGLKAADPGRVISPVMSASFDIQDNYRPESRAPRGERLMTLTTNLNQVAATSFQYLHVVAPANARMFVLKRMTWSGALPTATNQPGNVYAFVQTVAPTASGFVPTVFGQYKDGRNVTGSINQTSTGYLPATIGATPLGTIFNQAVYFELVTMGTAIAPFRLQVDNLDVVMQPNSHTDLGMIGDTLPVGNWFYQVCIEGYEYVPDPAELISPLP